MSGEVCSAMVELNILARVPLAGMLSKWLSGVGVGEACGVDCSAGNTRRPASLFIRLRTTPASLWKCELRFCWSTAQLSPY